MYLSIVAAGSVVLLVHDSIVMMFFGTARAQLVRFLKATVVLSIQDFHSADFALPFDLPLLCMVCKHAHNCKG